MNSLYTLALRQSSSLTADLQQLSSLYASPSTSTPSQTSALNGQINASLAALDRTIDDYDSMARREIVDVKKEKAMQRVSKFKDEYLQLRREYDRIKQQGQQHKTTSERSELFSSAGAPSASASASTSSISASASHSYGASQTSSRAFARPHPNSASSNPYASSPLSHSSSPDVSIPMGGPSIGGSGFGGGGDYASSMHNNSRTNYALREHDFMQQTGATLDAYLAQGQAVLGNLANQRDVMKGTQRRLLSAANTLGLSRETISFIERRTKADYYILLGGGAATLVCMYFILKYFG
ncbi:hypothetical protein JCM11251_007274 [Rhodosporidiobolus azoricus]